jgi:hypothetical protein
MAGLANVGATVTLWKHMYDTEDREKFIGNTKMQSQVGGAQLKGLANHLGFTWSFPYANDPKSMAAILPVLFTIFDGPEQKYEIKETTAERARLQCIKCMVRNTMQEMKITDDLCSVGSNGAFEGFAKAVNPKMTSTLVKASPLS